MFKNLVTNVNQNEKKLLVNFINDYYKKKTNVSNVDNGVDTVMWKQYTASSKR